MRLESFAWLSQLLLLFCLSLRVSGDPAICESVGTCLEYPSKCQCDPLQDCFTVSTDTKYPSYEPGTRDGAIISPGRKTSCEERLGWTSAGRTNITLDSVQLRYVSISPKFLAICVSWNVSQSSGSSGGFVVETIKGLERVNLRYCVSDSTRREMCINNLEYRVYHGQASQTLRVYPFPLAGDDIVQVHKRSAVIRNDLAGCSDADSSVGICGPNAYKAPMNVTVMSRVCDEGVKDLSISWLPPPEAKIAPQVYYVSLYVSRRRWKSFKVINSSQITVRNLSANVNYTTVVRAYGRCAGLGDYYTNNLHSCGTNQLGCGRPTFRITEQWADCPRATSQPAYSNNHATTSQVLKDSSPQNTAIIAVSVTVVVSCAFVIVLVVFAIVGIFKWRSSDSIVFPTALQKPKIFVFYSPSMCDSRLKSLQERIVCLLLEYFEVVTPDDISSGNISMWLEDTVKSVHSILLVANKEFCCDWNKSKDDRSPVMNSLELLISSAAAQNSIGKFGFVSSEDGLQDVFVPDHSYLKLMPVFLLGQKTCDIGKLYQFVTKSRGIEFSTDT